MRTVLLMAMSLAAACAVAGAPETLRFHGYAYDLKTNQYLYTEVHEQHIQDNRWISGTIDYFTPDGKQFGHKSLDFAKDPILPAYRMDQFDMGRIEAITDNGDPIRMLLKLPGKDEKICDAIAKKPLYTADSGFHMLIRSQFDQLMRGETVKFSFVVPSECDHFRFKMKRIDDATFEGKPAVRFKVEPSTLLSLLVDPLVMTYDPNSMQLLEFRGISNIHDPKSGKAYVARIAYYAKPPADAPKNLPPLGGPELHEPH